MNDKAGIVSIHGKEYQTVAYRVTNFRDSEKYTGWSIQTEILEADNAKVVMKAIICNPDGMVMATGHAEEIRGSSNINTTSCLENCETSAIGRCMATLGIGGTEFASADEVSQAIGQQNERAIYQRAQEHMTAVRENIDSILSIKNSIYDAQPTERVKGQFEFADESQLSVAIEAWSELDTEVMQALWLAPTKGGIFTTQERSVMKSDRWGALSRSAK